MIRRLFCWFFTGHIIPPEARILEPDLQKLEDDGYIVAKALISCSWCGAMVQFRGRP